MVAVLSVPRTNTEAQSILALCIHVWVETGRRTYTYVCVGGVGYIGTLFADILRTSVFSRGEGVVACVTSEISLRASQAKVGIVAHS